MPTQEAERERAREALRARAATKVAADMARRPEESAWESNWRNLLDITNPLTFAVGTVGLGIQAGRTAEQIAELPGTLGAKIGGALSGKSDEEIASTLRNSFGGVGRFLANEQMFDPVTAGPGGINGQRRDRLADMFPLLDTGITTAQNTYRRIKDPTEYVGEWERGTLPSAIMEDALNVAPFARGLGRALRGTAGASLGAGAAEAAGLSAERAATVTTRAAAPIRAADAALSRAVTPRMAGRMATVGKGLEKGATLGERGAFAPAWPARAVAFPLRRTMRAAEAGRLAVRAAEAAGDRSGLTLGQRALSPLGRGIEGVRQAGHKAWVSRATRPMVESRNIDLGEAQDLQTATIAPLREVERVIRDEDAYRGLLWVKSGGPVRRNGYITSAEWKALTEQAREALVTNWREQGGHLDLTVPGVTAGLEWLEYRNANVVPDAPPPPAFADPAVRARMERMNAGSALFDQSAQVLADHQRSGAGAKLAEAELRGEQVGGRTDAQQAYVDATLDNQPLDPFVEQRVDADHAAAIEAANKKLVAAQREWDRIHAKPLDAPDPTPNVGGVRVPGVRAPEPSLRRYDAALERLIRIQDRARGLKRRITGDVSKGERGVYSGAMDDLYRSKVREIEKELDAAPEPDLAPFEDLDVGNGQTRQRGELDAALEVVSDLRAQADEQASVLREELNRRGFGPLPWIDLDRIDNAADGFKYDPNDPLAPKGDRGYQPGLDLPDQNPNKSKVVTDADGMTVVERGKQGGEHDSMFQWDRATRDRWNRYAFKNTEGSATRLAAKKAAKGKGSVAAQKRSLDQWHESWAEGRDITVDQAIAEALEMIDTIEQLEQVRKGIKPDGDAWVAYIEDPDGFAPYVVDKFPDQYPKGMSTAWRNGLRDKRVRAFVANVADGMDEFHHEMAVRYGYEAEYLAERGARRPPPPKAEQVAARVDEAMNASAQRVWEAHNYDFVIGQKTAEGYGALTPAERRVYDALGTHSKFQGAQYKEQKAREQVAARRQEAFDRTAESVARQHQKAQTSVDAQVSRRTITAKKQGIREGTWYGKQLERRRVAQRELERAQRRQAETLTRRDADLANRLAEGEGLPANYRPAFQRNRQLQQAAERTAAQFDQSDPATAQAIRDMTQDIVVNADELMAAYGDDVPTFLTGGTITRGNTGHSPGGVPKARTSSADKAKSGDTAPLTPRGQAVVVMRRLRTDIMNKIVRTLVFGDENRQPWAVRTDDTLGFTDTDAGPVARSDSMNGQEIYDAMTAQLEGLTEHPLTGHPAGYRWVPWDPMNPLLDSVPVAAIKSDTLWLPEPMVQLFKAEWRDPGAWEQAAYRFLDKPVGVWKDQVLAFSPKWHLGNLVGGLVLATIAGGVNPVTLIENFAREWQRSAKPPKPGMNSWRTARAERNWNRAQQIDATMGELPRELMWGGGVDHQLQRYTRAIEVVDPKRGAVNPDFTLTQRPVSRYRRAADWSYDLNQRVDDAIRAALYTAKAGEGMAPEAALKLAMKSMPDFRLLPWEQQWMRRAFPFVAWIKHMTNVSARLARDHPMRVAWMLRISEDFQPDGSADDIGMLASSVPWLGGYVNLSWANPYGEVAVMNPMRLTGALSPVAKLGLEGFTGMTFDAPGRPMEPLSRRKGTGLINEYGTEGPGPLIPMPGAGGNIDNLKALGYRAMRMTPITRTLVEMAQPDVQRYDTGDEVKSYPVRGAPGRTIPQEQPLGPLGDLGRFAGLPIPVNRDAEAMRAAARERFERAERARAAYAR